MTTTMLWRKKGEPFFTSNGALLNAGTVNIYDATTTSNQTCWKDAAAASPWTQPITLDSSGKLTSAIYVGTSSFKEVVKDSGGSTISSDDNIPGATAVVSSTFAQPETPTLTKAANYTLTTSDLGKIIKTDSSGGDVTLTLPSAIAAGDGQQYWVQPVGTAGLTTIATAGGQTINGAASISTTRPYSFFIVESDGANWTAFGSDFPFVTLAKTTTYTVTTADRGKLVKCDTSGGAWTLNLPSASSAGDGFEVVAVKTTSDANAVTIDPNSTETINGSTTDAVSLLVRWDAVKLRCDGSNWQIVGGAKFYGLKVGIAASNLIALNSAGQFPAMPMGPVPFPQGRLTVTTGTPVINSDVTAATSVFYAPYVGQICPIYDGTNWQMWVFGEQTLTLNSSNHALNTLYDVIAFNNSGAFTIGTMPAWTTAGNFVSAGSLTTGTAARASALSRVQGLLVNTSTLTSTVKNGSTSYTVAANQGTYLGSIWIDATAGQISCHVAYGQNRKWGVWNAFNRVPIILLAGDSTATWTYGTNTVRASNGSAANSLTVLCGLQEEWVATRFKEFVSNAQSDVLTTIGIGVASTTATSGTTGQYRFGDTASVTTPQATLDAEYFSPPILGLQSFTALEKVNGSNQTFSGTNPNMELSASWRG